MTNTTAAANELARADALVAAYGEKIKEVDYSECRTIEKYELVLSQLEANSNEDERLPATIGGLPVEFNIESIERLDILDSPTKPLDCNEPLRLDSGIQTFTYSLT